MKRNLIYFALMLSGSLLANVVAVPQWSMPAEGKHRGELGTHESTRPLIVGDILYYANLYGYVYAMHRKSGYVLWKIKLPAGVEGALSYGRAKLFVGDVKGKLRALNARDGSVAWETSVKAEWLSPPVLRRRFLYAATLGGELYALTVRKGKEIWHYARRGDEKMTIRGLGGPVVYGSEVYMGFADGFVVALSAKEGKVLWAKKLRTRDRFYDTDMAPYVDANSVIVGNFDGALYSLDRLTGDTKWVLRVGGYRGLLVEKNRLYFSGLDGHIYAVDRRQGHVIWKTPFEGQVGLVPAQVGKHLVVTTARDPVYILNAKDGTVANTFSLGAGTFASAAAHISGWFYCLSNFGNLYSFKLEELREKRGGPETLTVPSAIVRHFKNRSKKGREAS